MTSLPKPILRQELLGVGLVMIAGYVDGFGLLSFKTYLSFMSGNTTQVGCNTGQGDFAHVMPSALAIVFFVVGVFSGSVLSQVGRRQSRQLALGGVGGLLGLVVVGTQLGSLSDGVRIAAVSLAMGIMNTTLSQVGNEQVNVTFVTGTLNKMGRHLALAVMRAPLEDSQGSWDTQLRRAFLLGCLWAGFVGGAMLAGIATPRLAGWTLLPPAILLLIMAFARSRAEQGRMISVEATAPIRGTTRAIVRSFRNSQNQPQKNA